MAFLNHALHFYWSVLGVGDLWPDLLSMLTISWVFDILRDALLS